MEAELGSKTEGAQSGGDHDFMSRFTLPPLTFYPGAMTDSLVLPQRNVSPLDKELL